MLKIDLWPEVQEFLETVSAKHKRQISARIFSLADDPLPLRSKQLEGYAPLRRFRSGDFRIVYFVEDSTLNVPLVDRRGDDKVYRRLKKLFG